MALDEERGIVHVREHPVIVARFGGGPAMVPQYGEERPRAYSRATDLASLSFVVPAATPILIQGGTEAPAPPTEDTRSM